MSYRLAINGYGRIGRCVLRALYESAHKHEMDIVAINELADIETIAHLTKYDSTHGRFRGEVAADGDTLIVNGDSIPVTHFQQRNQLPWGDRQVDLVLECSGSFTDRVSAEEHLIRGAKRVLFSQPAEPCVDATIVYGINHASLTRGDTIISNASCTTNCIVPVIKCLDEGIGIEFGHITTIHSAMNDQPVIDAYHHTDLRRTRSASASIIPVETQLAKGIGRVLPEFDNRFTASAMRVPTVNVSIMDLTVQTKRATSVVEVNRLLKNAATGKLAGILGYTDELLASCDFNHDARSSIVDGGQTCVTGERLVKVMAWFDNEWGFANRMLDVANVLRKID
ncbi:MAG: type I glyceraldehyde-3-phosphate dehydrogenase [Pseudomonadales bacterium]|nr:type I glyceraldehyde-3-phosphate dehydrogenase [Pseudomonadales bacterium]